MEINPKELQKFHDLWAPMIAALPAVISAAERANELVTHTAILQAKLDEVVAATESTKLEAVAHVFASQATLLDLATQKLALDAEVKEHAKDARKAIADAKAAADAKVKDHIERADTAAQAADAVALDLRQRLEAADRDFLAQKNEHEGILAALIEKQDAIKASIESLRAQLA